MIKAVTDFGILGQKNHLCCVCHMLHNFLKSIDEISEISNLIGKIRKIVKIVRKSVITTEKLNKFIFADQM